jgi:hypothetical protein
VNVRLLVAPLRVGDSSVALRMENTNRNPAANGRQDKVKERMVFMM